MADAARSSARTPDSDPPNVPIAVRTPSTIYASRIVTLLHTKLLFGSIGRPFEQPNYTPIAFRHRYSIEHKSLRRGFFFCRSGQCISRVDRRRVTHTAFDRHRYLTYGIRREGECAIGECVRNP